MTSKVWYLAGPMSGLPQFNVPKFDRITAILRGNGLTVINPAELDSDEMREEALKSDGSGGIVAAQEAGDFEMAGETWGDVLARDVKVISDQVAGIILMDGWHESRGARLEALVALLNECEFLYWDDKRSVTRAAFMPDVRRGIAGVL